MRVFLLLLVLSLPALAQPDLGETSFANSGAPAAQAPFLRGLLLLHSFEYDDARDAFQEARRVDPDFVMAAWGEAMTHNHPVWQRQDRDAALAALAGVDRRGATDRERAYLATLDVLFGDGDSREAGATKEDRDDAYAQAMADLAETYADDLDARSFYALALLGTAHEGRDFVTYMRAAAVAEEVFDENPRHPGAAHYLIHAYDDPVHAPLGLRPALVYDQIAPAASHALHMPSHIYLALGMWPEVAEMNERSFAAAKAGTDRRGEPLNGHGWHALWWWHYAETQRDDAPAARRLYDLAVALAGGTPTTTAGAHLTRIRAQHVAAMGEGDVLNGVGLGDDATPHDLYAHALQSLASGAPDGVREAHRAFLSQQEGADEAGWSERSAERQLAAWGYLADGDVAAAVAAAQAAAAIENAAPLTFGPPSPVVPANEMLGGLLLDLDRPAEAAEAFEAALARAPNRRQSVDGLERARRAMARPQAPESGR